MKVGLAVGILFLLAITLLGIEVLPNVVLAIGMFRLARERCELSAVGEVRNRWQGSSRPAP